MIEVVVTDEFEAWYMALDEHDAEAVTEAVGVLEQMGVALGFPRSSGLEGTKLRELRELRIQSRGRPLRVAYAFDPLRQVVLLIGGDKKGDDRFYHWFIPTAEKVWLEYLTAREKRDDGGKEVAGGPGKEVLARKARKDR